MASTPTPNRPRVFLDASVIFAAALSARGYTRDLLLAGMRAIVPLATSRFALDEAERNLRDKAPAALPAFRRFRQTLSALGLKEPHA